VLSRGNTGKCGTGLRAVDIEGYQHGTSIWSESGTPRVSHLNLRRSLASRGGGHISSGWIWAFQYWVDWKQPSVFREMEGGREITIVALSASAFNSQKEDVLSAGLDDFLRKPHRSNEVFDCKARHLGIRYISSMNGQLTMDEVPEISCPEDLLSLPKQMRLLLQETIIRPDVSRINFADPPHIRRTPEDRGHVAIFAIRYEYTSIPNLLENFNVSGAEARA
jgi:CheY-like chemotaxis protein